MKKRIWVIVYIGLALLIIGALLIVLDKYDIIDLSGKNRPNEIKLNYHYLGLKENQNFQLSAYLFPEKILNYDLIYESSNEEIIEVNAKTGYFKTLKEGTSIIKVYHQKYPKIYDTCTVTVSNKDLQIEKINLQKEEINLQIGDSYLIDYEIVPHEANLHEIEYITSNSDILIVHENLVFANNPGEATITILDKISQKQEVLNVKVSGEGKTSNFIDNIFLKVGEEKKIEFKGTISSYDNIISIDNGVIKGLKKGSGKITITGNDDIKEIGVIVSSEIEGKYQATFEDIALSCEEKDGYCEIEVPYYVSNGYEVLGWSTKKDDYEIEVSFHDKINLTSNQKYYVVKRKLVTADFLISNLENASSDETTKFCYLYNDDETCEIKAPTLVGKNNYIALGWSKKENTNQAMINNQDTIFLHRDSKYYGVVVQRNYLTATFNLQDNDALKESSRKVTCELENSSSCQIKVPKLTNNSEYILVGWSRNQNNLNPEYHEDSIIDISSDVSYYAITKKEKPLTANFIIQNNTATKENNNTSCELYNGKTSCEITVPKLVATTGNIVIGWNLDKTAKEKTLDGGEKIVLTKDLTYYSITRSINSFKVNFVVQDSKNIETTSSKEECYPYNGEKTCIILIPTLKSLNSNTNVIGWNSDNHAKISQYEMNKELEISGNKNVFSISSSKVTITFTVGENVANANIKATKLSFNHTDKSGKTIIDQEGEKLTTTCISYNQLGCKVNRVPTIYSEGYFIDGFAKTPSGKIISVYDTTFKEDTSLYAKTGYTENKKVGKTNVGYSKIYGNVILEIDKNLGSSDIEKIKEYYEILYKYYPELFYFNGKITIYSKAEYYKNLKAIYSKVEETAGLTFTDKGFSNVTSYYDATYGLHYTTHELGHAFNYLYQRSTGTYVSKSTETIHLFNKYKNVSNRPLSDYAYSSSARTEFVSEALAETIRILLYEKTKKYYYTSLGSLTNDIKNAMVGYLNKEKQYLVKEGIIN